LRKQALYKARRGRKSPAKEMQRDIDYNVCEEERGKKEW